MVRYITNKGGINYVRLSIDYFRTCLGYSRSFCIRINDEIHQILDDGFLHYLERDCSDNVQLIWIHHRINIIRMVTTMIRTPRITVLGAVTTEEKNRIEDIIDATLMIAEAEGKIKDDIRVSDIVFTVTPTGEFYLTMKGGM